MITEIHLENFKRFRDLKLKAANLTVLTGTNGSGKTSILHSLLLARQIAREPGKKHLELYGVDTLELGSFSDVIHWEASNAWAAVEVLDTWNKRWRWSFGSRDNDEDTRTLNANVLERPDNYSGALAEPAPEFCYLCAERLGPRDVLSANAAEAAEFDVGPQGEFVAQVLESSGRSHVSAGRIEGVSTEPMYEDLLHQTESWMSKIVRPVQIQAEWFPNTSVTRLLFKTPGLRTEWTRAPNTGFGISYALPIVVAALCAKNGGLLVVENPEAHLHPAGQSKIGGFLAQVASDGVQVFLETHSDHVLNGMRVAIADGSASLSPEQIAIHFFQAEDDEVQSMEIMQTGQLSNWPIGFFDQAQVDLATLASKRRRNP